MLRFKTSDVFLCLAILFASLELFYFPFRSLVQREFYSLTSIFMSTLTTLLGIYYQKSIPKKSMAYILLLQFLIVGYSWWSYILMTNFAWLGTSAKYFLYISFYFLVVNSGQPSRNVLRFFYIYLVFLLASSGVFGYVLGNDIILNGRYRFAGLAHTPSVFAMFCMMASFYIFWYQKTFNITFTGAMALTMSIFLVWHSGSRQPVIALVIILTFYLFKSKLLFVFLRQIKCLFFVLFVTMFAYLALADISFFLEPLKILAGLDGSFYSRISYLSVGINFLQDSNLILLGSGFNSFPQIYLAETNLEAPATHNIILTLVTNFGLLFSFVIILMLFRYTSIRNFDSAMFVLLMVMGTSLNNPDYFISISMIAILMVSMFNAKVKES